MSSPGAAPGSDTITITIPPNINLLTGPQLIGLYFNWGLLGILGTQVYIYYLTFPRDPRYVKVFVYGLFVLEVAQTCMISSDGYHWMVSGWGHPDALTNSQLTWFDIPIMAGIISSAVQIFFGWRIWLLGKSILLSGTIITIALIQGVAGIAAGVMQSAITDVTQLEEILPAGSVWLGGSAFVDILIAVSMIYLLSRARGGFSTTNHLLSRLIRLTVETGALTATVATVDVILFNVFKTNNLHMCPAFVLAKLYTNTLMVVLNQRMFTPSNNMSPAAQSHSSIRDVEPGVVYRARFAEPMPGQGGASPKAFKDTFRAGGSVRNIPMAPITVHTQVRSYIDPMDPPSKRREKDLKYTGNVV